jgi:4-hydroxy-2-oxoheptanedioate aldolase
MLGLKIENKRALVNVELTTQVPGIAFAEWGPGDMSMSFGYKELIRDPFLPELQEARSRIFNACKAAGLAFLDGMTTDNAGEKIDEGVRISSGGPEGEAIARVARAHAGRTMPV